MFVAEWHAECSRVQLQAEHGQDGGEHHSLRALAVLLLRPLEDLLIDLEGMPLVVMAPAGLQPVPFEALPFTVGDVVDTDAPPRRFAETFALRFAAGMHDLAAADLQLDLAPAAGASLLALMVPDATTPRIAEETERLAAIHPDATILSGADASVDALTHLARHHDVVHLACHGLYWPEHPSSSGLRLGDRWVTSGEILRMDLSGCLVVLNACATGRAHDTTTESIGLAWALLAAGARGVVATTWPVDDHVALEFADRFHRRLAEGESPAESVRLAGADLATELSDHPWAWAAHRYIAAGATLLQED
jgi:CHAT domain-containing protein